MQRVHFAPFRFHDGRPSSLNFRATLRHDSVKLLFLPWRQAVAADLHQATKPPFFNSCRRLFIVLVKQDKLSVIGGAAFSTESQHNHT
jgi:hypothetical protein